MMQSKNHGKFIAGILAMVLSLSPSAGESKEKKNVQETVNICAIMKPKLGKEAELRSSLLAMIEPTRNEAGSLAYDLHETKDGLIFLYESWRTQHDLDLHFEKPYLKDLVAKLGNLIDGANDAHFGKLVGSTLVSEQHFIQIDDPKSSVHICSIKGPKEGKANDLKVALLDLVEPTKKEKGVIAYNVFEEKSGAIFLYEVWKSEKDLLAHFEQPYVKSFRKKVGDLALKNDVYIGHLISAPAKAKVK